MKGQKPINDDKKQSNNWNLNDIPFLTLLNSDYVFKIKRL